MNNENTFPRVISEYSYNILKICKKVPYSIEEIQEYIKQEYLNISFLSYELLYINLLEVIFEVCNSNQIKRILAGDIPHYSYSKAIENMSFKISPLSYEDLCKVLINKLCLLQVRDSKKDVDFFAINLGKKIVSMDEYDEMQSVETLIRKK